MLEVFNNGIVVENQEDYLLINLRKLDPPSLAAVLSYIQVAYWMGDDDWLEIQDYLRDNKDGTMDWSVIVDKDDERWEFGPMTQSYAVSMAEELRAYLGPAVTVEGR